MKYIYSFLIGAVLLSFRSVKGFSRDDNGFTNIFEMENVRSMDPKELLKQKQFQAKLAANELLPEPIPGEPLPGPSLATYIDPQSACTFGDIDRLNEDSVLSTVEDLSHSTYFRYFKADLDAECPYWVIDRICKMGGSCSIGRCEEDEIPQCVRDFDSNHKTLNALPAGRIIDAKFSSLFQKWNDSNDDFWAITQYDSRNPRAFYVDLRENVESNTGYAGEEPRMIWNAIYNENCFKAITSSDPSQMCLEERLFYRLISGMHTEISVHVFAKWKLDPYTLTFLPNQGLWNKVFGAFPERLDSLYFTLNFLIESLHALQPYAASILPSLSVGDEKQDTLMRELFMKLLNSSNACNYKKSPQDKLSSPRISSFSPDELDTISLVIKSRQEQINTTSFLPSITDMDILADNYDENYLLKNFTKHSSHSFPPNELFQTGSSYQLRDQLQNMFRNVSRIMNCVGCEKCRVWSKLHTLGLGTALKVSLSTPGVERAQTVASLQRNELVALVNSLLSFSEAVHYVRKHMVLSPNPSTLDYFTLFNADSSPNIPSMHVDSGKCTLKKILAKSWNYVAQYLPFFRHYVVEDTLDETPQCFFSEKVSILYISISMILVFISLYISFFRQDGTPKLYSENPEYEMKNFGNEIHDVQLEEENRQQILQNSINRKNE